MRNAAYGCVNPPTTMNIGTKLLVATITVATMTSCSKDEPVNPSGPPAPLREKAGTQLRYTIGLSNDHGTASVAGLNKDVALVLRWSVTDPTDPVQEAFAKIYMRGTMKEIKNKVLVALETETTAAAGNEAREFKIRLNVSGTELAQGFLDGTYILMPEQAWTVSGAPVEVGVEVQAYEVL